MTILEAMQKTITEAKTSGNLCYLYEKDDGYWVSTQYQKDWLFRAYPGGRKELSMRGSKLVHGSIAR